MTGASAARRSTGTHAPLTVLFVCTANISRSPYAERRARQVLPLRPGGGITFASAGIPGYPGRGMDPAMAELLVARGGDASGHVSRAVDEQILRRADLVVVFEFAHHMRLLDSFPRHRHVILGLHQAARAVGALGASRAEDSAGSDAFDRVDRLVSVAGQNSMSLDVEDPYRRGARAAEACADEIDQLLDVVLTFLAGREVPRLAPPPVAVPTERTRALRPAWRLRRPAPRRALP